MKKEKNYHFRDCKIFSLFHYHNFSQPRNTATVVLFLNHSKLSRKRVYLYVDEANKNK